MSTTACRFWTIKDIHLCATRPHIASEYFENATVNGIPLLLLTYIPSQSAIVSMSNKFHKGKLSTAVNNDSLPENVVEQESYDPKFVDTESDSYQLCLTC